MSSDPDMQPAGAPGPSSPLDTIDAPSDMPAPAVERPEAQDSPIPDVPAVAPAAPVRIRARGRSFLALVLSPERPLSGWLHGLDAQVARSAAFLAGKPIILDLALLHPDDDGLANLLPDLVARDIRVIGIEGCTPDWPALAGWEWPDALGGGRASGAVDIPETDLPSDMRAEQGAVEDGMASDPIDPVRPLVIEDPVRSGQVVTHLKGDVIVVGSVSSGAEIVASGSIHVLGALRGRAIAGFGGHPHARIFARDMRAELLAIDGYYMTAEDIGDAVSGHPAQALLEGDEMAVRKLP